MLLRRRDRLRAHRLPQGLPGRHHDRRGVPSRGEPDLACFPRTRSPRCERVLDEERAPLPQRAAAPRGRPRRPRPARSRHGARMRASWPTRPAALRSARAPRARDAARAEDRLEEAMEGCRKLLELDTDDVGCPAPRCPKIESVLLDREVDGLVGMALSLAADGELLSPRHRRREGRAPRAVEPAIPAAAGLPDEEGPPAGGRLVATAREHLAAGRDRMARRPRAPLTAMPGHARPTAGSSSCPSHPPGRGTAEPGAENSASPGRTPTGPAEPLPCPSAAAATGHGRAAHPRSDKVGPRTRGSPKPWP